MLSLGPQPRCPGGWQNQEAEPVGEVRPTRSWCPQTIQQYTSILRTPFSSFTPWGEKVPSTHTSLTFSFLLLIVLFFCFPGFPPRASPEPICFPMSYFRTVMTSAGKLWESSPGMFRFSTSEFCGWGVMIIWTHSIPLMVWGFLCFCIAVHASAVWHSSSGITRESNITEQPLSCLYLLGVESALLFWLYVRRTLRSSLYPIISPRN